VAAGRFLEHRREAVLLEEFDGSLRRRQEEIIFAGGKPQKLPSLAGMGRRWFLAMRSSVCAAQQSSRA
jgi:hypothetical protein